MKPKRTIEDVEAELDVLFQQMMNIIQEPDFERTGRFNPMYIRQQFMPILGKIRKLKEEKRILTNKNLH